SSRLWPLLHRSSDGRDVAGRRHTRPAHRAGPGDAAAGSATGAWARSYVAARVSREAGAEGPQAGSGGGQDGAARSEDGCLVPWPAAGADPWADDPLGGRRDRPAVPDGAPARTAAVR